MRILVGFVEVAGHFGRLVQGFRSLGQEADFIDLSGNIYSYDAPRNPILIQILTYLIPSHASIARRKSSFEKLILSLVHILAKIPLFIVAILRYEVFIFTMGRGFFASRDLIILKLFRKRVICVFNGSDSRPPYLSGFVSLNNTEEELQYCYRFLQRITSIVKLADKNADFIVDHPPQGLLHSRSYITHFALGMPAATNITDSLNVTCACHNTCVRIVHAPSRPQPKGTYILRSIITELQAEGLPIDWIEIIGKSNSEVLSEISRCDFVVDQVYADTPMAGFAAEAAIHGKPAVVGGYYAPFLYSEFPVEFIPPSIFCLPGDLKAAIREMIINVELREQLGSAAKQFVHERWRPDLVAANYLHLLNQSIPHNWWFDPRMSRYIDGVGFSKDAARKSVQRFVARFGIKAIDLPIESEAKHSLLEQAKNLVCKDL